MGVDKEAPLSDIKKAYRKLAQKYHPDKNQGDKRMEEKFKEVSEAYDVLGDEDKRQTYDQMGSQPHFQNGYDFDPTQYGFDPNQVRYEYAGNDGYSDFFNTFFSGNGVRIEDLFSGLRGQGRNGYDAFEDLDIRSEIEITLEEGAQGGKKHIQLQTASGRRTINFTIPKGVKNGEQIRLKGLGYASSRGRQGDLLMKVKLTVSREYEVQGNDLYKTVDIYPWDAALGGEIKVKTLSGTVNVRIPAHMQPGKKIRIPHKGYGTGGHLYLIMRIVNPDHLDAKTKALYQQMKTHHHKSLGNE